MAFILLDNHFLYLTFWCSDFTGPILRMSSIKTAIVLGAVKKNARCRGPWPSAWESPHERKESVDYWVELKAKERISPVLDWKHTLDSSCPSRWPWSEQEMTFFFSARFWNWFKLKGKREETLSPRVLTNNLASPPRPMFKTVDDIECGLTK